MYFSLIIMKHIWHELHFKIRRIWMLLIEDTEMWKLQWVQQKTLRLWTPHSSHVGLWPGLQLHTSASGKGTRPSTLTSDLSPVQPWVDSHTRVREGSVGRFHWGIPNCQWYLLHRLDYIRTHSSIVSSTIHNQKLHTNQFLPNLHLFVIS